MTQRSVTGPVVKRNISFAQNLSVHQTWPPNIYDRRGDPATCKRLTPQLAQSIKEELNAFKMEEMEVHAASRVQYVLSFMSLSFITDRDPAAHNSSYRVRVSNVRIASAPIIVTDDCRDRHTDPHFTPSLPGYRHIHMFIPRARLDQISTISFQPIYPLTQSQPIPQSVIL